jgi:hypothetical protein
MAQVVEHLPSKPEFKPQCKRERRERERERERENVMHKFNGIYSL